MKTALLFILFLYSAIYTCSAQHEADNWYFPNNSGITFKNGSPVPLSGGLITGQAPTIEATTFGEGCGTVSDRTTGALLFYTDGVTVWNSQHQVMQNGTGLKGGISSSQNVLIVPNPANTLQYYVFTVSQIETNQYSSYYSIVSMETPGGEVLSKNTFLLGDVSEKITGTGDCSGTGYWVLTHHKSKSIFYSYHVTASGVETTPVISNYAGEISDYEIGWMKISPNKTKLALASWVMGAYVSLFDFNAATGEVSNYTVINNGVSGQLSYGIAFSPDNTKLYTTIYTTYTPVQNPKLIIQYDLTLPDVSAIRNSATIMKSPNTFLFALQLGPDGKIYMPQFGTQFLDVIDKPNLKGYACGYRTNAVSLTSISKIGMPNFMDYNFGRSSDTVVLCSNGNGSSQIGPPFMPGFLYSWSPSEGLSNPNIANPIASPNHTIEYRLKVTSPTGCESYQTYVVTIASKPTVTPPIAQICSGSSIRLSASHGDSYLWTPSIGLNSDTIANPLASPTVSTRYKVIVSRGDCIDSAFVDVNVNHLANVSEVPPICPGTSIQLSASGGSKYVWFPSTGLNDSTKQNPIASPKVTTRYGVVVSDAACLDTAYVTVTVVQKPKGSAGNDKTICTGNSVQIGDTVTMPGDIFQWIPVEGLNDPTVPNPIASPISSTKYIVKVTRNNCISFDTVLVSVVPGVKAKVSNDTSICKGSSVQLSASGGNSYSWLPSSGLSDPAIANPIASPLETTMYHVYVSNGSCIDSGTVTVAVTQFSGANAGADITVCPGASAVIGTIAEKGNIYLWQPTTGLDDAAKSNPTVSPIVTTHYILKVTNQQGCVGYDTVLVTVSNTLTAKVSNDTAICSGSSIQLLASGGSTYKWSPSIGLDNPNIPNPIATPTTTTQYKVRVSSGSCEDFDSVTVTVNPSPIAIAGSDLSSCKGEALQLGSSSQSGNTYSWEPITGLNDPTLSNPIAMPTVTTKYILKVTNISGCFAYDTVLVSVGNHNITVSGDTSVCSGTPVQLSATGGSNYLWSPSIGLDNPTIANPICSINSTTRYRVIVSNGTCIDSAFMTVNIIPSPSADAGKDKTICAGEQTIIGTSGSVGSSYSWLPATGLSTPLQSETIANPTASTTYILKAVSLSGCINYDTVMVTVNKPKERLFTLTPSANTILPGEVFQISLNVPNGVESWILRLNYDNLAVKFGSILQTTNGITATASESGDHLVIQGRGENGNVIMNFIPFLPVNFDTVFTMQLTVDSSEFLPCDTIITQGSILTLGEYCARKIRNISSTGKKFYLLPMEKGVNFGIGLQGRVRIELYDYVGTLKEILVDGLLESGEYSLDFDIPAGVYFCRINAGMYTDVRKIFILSR